MSGLHREVRHPDRGGAERPPHAGAGALQRGAGECREQRDGGEQVAGARERRRKSREPRRAEEPEDEGERRGHGCLQAPAGAPRDGEADDAQDQKR